MSTSFYKIFAQQGAHCWVGSVPERGSVGLVSCYLIDENCFSATEAFASVVKETRAATLIGRRTNGAMLSAIALPVEGDWTLWLPVWDFRTPRGMEVEGRGVEPDIAATYREGEDADIAAALKFLATTFQKKEF